MNENLLLPSLAPAVDERGVGYSFAWSQSRGKRIVDFLLASLLLFITAPFMLVCAVLIKCTSPGPVLFRQFRVGWHGKTFQLLKFRTMIHNRPNQGPGLTRQGDRRIFPVGRFLRRWKLDELPQFWNVIRGDMSLVGPRPDLPEYLASLPSQEREALDLIRPGITGAATVRFRNEEELLASIPPERLIEFYISKLLPVKISLDLAYARDASVMTDLGIILGTVTSILPRFVSQTTSK